MVTENEKYNIGAAFPPTNKFEGFHAVKFMKREWILHQKRIVALEEFIKLLLKSDHIYKPSIDATLNILKKGNETIQDMYKYLPGEPVRSKC